MIKKFSKLVDDLCYRFTLAEIKVENEKQTDLSHNSALYRKIICKESGVHTISSIAKLLSVKTTAVTQKVNELEQKNYVTRSQSENDKRTFFLHGVTKSCPCKNEFLKRDEYVLNRLLDEYSAEEIAEFLKIFERTNSLYSEFDNQ